MAGVSDADDHHPGAVPGERDPETSDVIAHIRELTVGDSRAVQQVVAEVLAALDRVTGAVRDGSSDAPASGAGYDEPAVSVADMEARVAERQLADPAPDDRSTSKT
jgi:hypothetical protein